MSATSRPSDGRLSIGLLLALTFSTGVVDAVGVLGLDGVFTGNMTGNVVLIGISLLSPGSHPIVGLVVALAGFVVGAVAAGRVLRRAPGGWTAHPCWLLGATAVLLAACTVAVMIVPDPESGTITAITAVLAVAMGVQAAAARHVGVKDLSTVVVTSTLTGLAADSWLGRRSGQPWFRRLAAIAMIGLGAVAGAGLTLLDVGAGIALSLVVTVAVAVTAAFSLVRQQPGSSPSSASSGPAPVSAAAPAPVTEPASVSAKPFADTLT